MNKNKQIGGNMPPFMLGLQAARKVLLTLRQKKLNQLAQSQLLLQNQRVSQQLGGKQPEQILESSNVQETVVETVQKSKKEELSEKINEIGKELYDCYQQNEAYQLIFAKLCDYYGRNLKTVEENEKLKRKSYQLQEDISSYKIKIKQNYQKIQQNQTNTAYIRVLIQQQLQQYLKEDKQKADIQPLAPLRSVRIDLPRQYTPSSKEQNNEKPKLTLNWRLLSQTSKKPQVRRSKIKLSQQQKIRTSFASSQLYNL